LNQLRHIAHFDLDSFFVSVERLKNDALRGKPVIVGGNGERAVVAACSYETRKFGVHSAMPVKQAIRLCPDALIVNGSIADYSKYSRLVEDIINQKMPLVEKASIDEFYIDLTGMDKLYGCYQLSKQLKAEISSELGLPVSFALASNKLISKIATNEAKPDGNIQIFQGTEKQFIAPLIIEKMPMVGKSTTDILHSKGIYSIGQLAEFPLTQLRNELGKNGDSLWAKANGIDHTPVLPFHLQKSFSKENTFETDTIDTIFLHQELVGMVEKLCYELRLEGKLTGCIAIKIRYDNFENFTKQATIEYSASDHLIKPIVKTLFTQLYSPNRPVRLLGVRFSSVILDNGQLNLFQNESQMPGLYQAIDQVKKKYGVSSLQSAISMQSNNHHYNGNIDFGEESK